MANKQRVDQLLVQRGLVKDIDEAGRLVMAGRVRCRGQVIIKPSEIVSSQDEIQLVQSPPFVSRGGEKLQAAFDDFPVSVQDVVCADVGASTGGFTDCLLQHGAARVYAIDVGYGLLDWKLRNDPRVILLERTNARELKKLPEEVEFISADVSFISLKRIFPVMAHWYREGVGQALVLIKPQFEASREESARGAGVILDPEVHSRVLQEVLEYAFREGFLTRGLIRSPLLGPAGNQEFIAWLAYQQSGWEDADQVDLITPLIP
jgi:23S rRNA (cytidine1920-2'-O)/16S rRNA (cytidine1409-2'-O)-methyltransferase